MRIMKKFFGTMLTYLGFGYILIALVVIIVWGIQFNINVNGHLKRAADANTIELAKQELSIAINYLEKNDMTDGYTSILWKTPDEDIGFWYNNIKSSYEELKNLPTNSTQLEKSNTLMKLRETLLDDSRDGTTVTRPNGIAKYPYNKTMFYLWFISLFVGFSGVVLSFVSE